MIASAWLYVWYETNRVWYIHGHGWLDIFYCQSGWKMMERSGKITRTYSPGVKSFTIRTTKSPRTIHWENVWIYIKPGHSQMRGCSDGLMERANERPSEQRISRCFLSTPKCVMYDRSGRNFFEILTDAFYSALRIHYTYIYVCIHAPTSSSSFANRSRGQLG